MGCPSARSVATNENNTANNNTKGKNEINKKEEKKEDNKKGENKEDKKTKYFHDMSEEEKEKIKKVIEEQDKNIEEKFKDSQTPYEQINWNDLRKKLPVGVTKEEREERLKIWKQLNEYGNGYMSFKRLNVQVTNYLNLPEILRKKDIIKLAFEAAIDKYTRHGVSKEDNLLEWMEFRIFLKYLRLYFEYWEMFEKVNRTREPKITLEEFKKAIPRMKEWGVEIKENEAEKEFNNIKEDNKDTISFEEFCDFAIQKSLDLDEDDDFDDEELKNLK